MMEAWFLTVGVDTDKQKEGATEIHELIAKNLRRHCELMFSLTQIHL